MILSIIGGAVVALLVILGLATAADFITKKAKGN